MGKIRNYETIKKKIIQNEKAFFLRIRYAFLETPWPLRDSMSLKRFFVCSLLIK
jgi:hypothetical protein